MIRCLLVTAVAALTALTIAGQSGGAVARKSQGVAVKTVVRGLEIPWDIAFLPDRRALITERPGRVRLLSRSGRLRRTPAARVAVQAEGEGGLLGLALDPSFRRNRLVYLYYTTSRGMVLARYKLRGNRLIRRRTILRGIEAGARHDSGRIAFGPDRKLYVATGDANKPGLAQDPGSLNGKFLALGARSYRGAGGRAEIVSSGHRNPQGLDWQPRSRRLIATEHGPTGNDEINHIRRGHNYGWPEVFGPDHGRFTAPLAVYPTSIAPSGATFVTRGRSAWRGNYLVAALRGEQIRRLVFRGGRIVRQQALFQGRFGRIRTVVEGPRGRLYALTSNRDGRGEVRPGDDRLLQFRAPR